jgi:hypothetical protein
LFVTRRHGQAWRGALVLAPRALREKTHSSDGGRKAYLNFELKD